MAECPRPINHDGNQSLSTMVTPWRLDAMITECLSTPSAAAAEFAANRANRSEWALSSGK